MITSLKLIGSAYFLLPNLIFIAAVRFCTPSPVCNLITPNSGEQGTDVTVTLTGDHFGIFAPPWIYTSEMISNNPDFTIDFNSTSDPWNDVSATFRVHIGPTAILGSHRIVLQTDGGAASIPFSVTSPGCPLPPQLFTVVSDNGTTLRPGGTVTFRFEGANLLNNNPQVQASSDIHVAPGPYNVQGGGNFEYFRADITADPTAAGSQYVYVTTCGNSNLVYITVDASQPPPSPTPGGTPSLGRITPTVITRFASQFTNVSIKFQGTGFGLNHEIVVDSNSTISGFATLNEYQSDPNQVVVGIPTMNLPTGPDALVTLRVHNLSNGTMSNPYVLLLGDPDPNAPVVTANFFVGGPIHQNSSADLYLEGENLQGFNAQNYQICLSGIPGMTFSNFRLTAPIFGGAQAFYVTVHADASAPISADEATNFIITTADGQSNPFFVQILPPF